MGQDKTADDQRRECHSKPRFVKRDPCRKNSNYSACNTAQKNETTQFKLELAESILEPAAKTPTLKAIEHKGQGIELLPQTIFDIEHSIYHNCNKFDIDFPKFN